MALCHPESDHFARGYCRQCYNKWYYNRNPERTNNLDSRLSTRYGIDHADVLAMEASQGGVCAICGNPQTPTKKGRQRMLNVDHNHQTGEVRGLLCQHCNSMLGFARESIDTLMAGARYLAERGSSRA